MHFIELSAYSLALYLFFLMLFIPLGTVVSRKLLREHSDEFCFLSSFGFSAITYALVLTAGLFFKLGNETLQIVLLCIFGSGFYFFIAKREYRIFFQREIIFILCFFFLYLLWQLAFVSFPENNFRDISAFQTMFLADLPVDNIIPYNLSRYVIEGYDPNELEIVKYWQVSNRGPLAGLLNAVVFIMLGLEETEAWLYTSSGLAFLYQALMSFLNLLSLFTVFFITKKIYGKKAAIFAILALSISYFYFLNTFFTWPKFFSAYFLLTALYMLFLQKERNFFVFGLFLAAAYLSHDLAIFFIASLAVYFLYFIFKKKVSAKSSLIALGSFLLLYSPWLYFKTAISVGTARGIYLFAFCYSEEDVNIPFSKMLFDYFGDNHLIGIFKIRLYNLFYPFNLKTYFLKTNNWISYLDQVEHIAFNQLIGALSIPFFILFILHFAKKENREKYLPFFLIGLCSLLFCSALAGCFAGTANHQWCYPFYLILFIAIGGKMSENSPLTNILVFVAISFNIFSTLYFLHNDQKIFLHAAPSYFIAQSVLLCSIFAISYWELRNERG